MNLTDVIGPIMVGPSSSHTAGVVRIGKVAYSILGYTPKEAEVKFYRSFAKTYKGHGSDKAIVGGLLNFEPDDERIRDSITYAKNLGYNFNIIPSDRYTKHPNTVKITALDINGEKCEITAESVGGGDIRIRKINRIDVELDGTYDTIITNHIDVPGVVTKITGILFDHNINIATMKVFRDSKGEKAMMLIEIDSKPEKETMEEINKLPNIYDVTFVPKIF